MEPQTLLEKLFYLKGKLDLYGDKAALLDAVIEKARELQEALDALTS